ncbi:hypothetical protein Lser_V15G31408 [Lactuca serriola]
MMKMIGAGNDLVFGSDVRYRFHYLQFCSRCSLKYYHLNKWTKKNLETLTTHQEESLTSADQNDNLEAKGTEKENVVLDDDSYPHEKENETTTEDKLRRSIQQDSQEELPTDEVHDDTMGTPGIANFDVYDDLVDASIIQSLDGIEKLESDDNLEEDPADDVNSVIPDSDLQEATINESDIDDKETQEFLESFTEKEVLDGGLVISIPIPTPIPEPKLLNMEKTFDSMDLENLPSAARIPATSVLSPSLQTLPGKVLVPAVVDQVQGQSLAALKVLKVIEGDVQPGDLCTCREYVRWLVSANSALSRNTLSKVYPIMYIKNVTELAFDDITPANSDFSSIQAWQKRGLIANKLSQRDMNISNQDESSLNFCPER